MSNQLNLTNPLNGYDPIVVDNHEYWLCATQTTPKGDPFEDHIEIHAYDPADDNAYDPAAPGVRPAGYSLPVTAALKIAAAILLAHAGGDGYPQHFVTHDDHEAFTATLKGIIDA